MTQPDPHELHPIVEAFYRGPVPIVTPETQLQESAAVLNTAIYSFASTELDRLQHVVDPAQRATGMAYLDTLVNGSSSRIRGGMAMNVYLMSQAVDYQTAVALGVHTEMVQAYIVIVDDEIDGTEYRRGEPVAHRQVANTLREDTTLQMTEDEIKYITRLRAEAYQLRAYSEPFSDLLVRPQYLQAAMDESRRITAETALGQITEVANRRNLQLSEDEVLGIYRTKTAQYTVVAPLLVARILDAGIVTDAENHYLTAFGEAFGTAFQLRDDLKMMETYYAADPTLVPDKDEAADIVNGTITPLVLHALDPANRDITDSKKRFLQNMLQATGQQSRDPKDFEKQFRACQEILHDSGSVQYVKGLAQQYQARAAAVLEEAESRHAISPELARFLRAIAR